jgi:hypothetical protein
MQRVFFLFALLSVCGLASQASAAVVISFDNTTAEVTNGTTYSTQSFDNTGGTVASASLPGYSSTTTSNFSTVGNSGAFSASFVQARGGDVVFGYSNGYAYVEFTPSANVSYTASGTYSNSGGFTYLVSYLFDFTTNAYTYYNYQESVGGPATFILGGTAGNYGNYLQGSLTGTLLAGHTYQWLGQGATEAYPTADLGAEGSGGVSLTIGTAAVPEVSSALVWSLLALTIGGTCWCQKSARAI